MKWRAPGRRALSLLLTVMMLLQLFAGTMTAGAASDAEPSAQNLVKHGDFGSKEAVKNWSYDIDKKQLDHWWSYTEGGTRPERVEGNAYSGLYAAKLDGTNQSLQQDIDGLIVGAEYTVFVWAKNTNPETVC